MNRFLLRLKKISLSFALLAIVLAVMLFLSYTDFSVVLTIYLPVLLIGLVAALLGFDRFTNILFLFAGAGLCVEYLIHLQQKDYPRMTGTMLNTLILFAGVGLGAVLQYMKVKKEKESKKKDRH